MEKYKTCRYAESSGQIAVYVTPNCPRAKKIKGNLVVTKGMCRECRSWKEKRR